MSPKGAVSLVEGQMAQIGLVTWETGSGLAMMHQPNQLIQPAAGPAWRTTAAKHVQISGNIGSQNER